MPDPVQEGGEEELDKLAQELAETYPHTSFYTGHCTGDIAFGIMKKHLGPRIEMFKCGQQFDI
jgi:7,8-dihydropterin-6-yl-methyl-4-(beta-D-ribofuranosyl)aminobenzene 5'-phosphate synthase